MVSISHFSANKLALHLVYIAWNRVTNYYYINTLFVIKDKIRMLIIFAEFWNDMCKGMLYSVIAIIAVYLIAIGITIPSTNLYTQQV